MTVNVCPTAGVPEIVGVGLEVKESPAVTDSVEAEVTVVVVKPDWLAVILTEIVLPASAEDKTYVAPVALRIGELLASH